MSETVERLSSNKVRIALQIPPERFEDGLNRAFIKNRGRFNIPGFRKGKAPRQIVERFYGESVLFEDAFDIVFPEEYGRIVRENGLEVVSRPDLDIKTINRQDGVSCTAEVYVRPEFELGEYKGVKAIRPVYDVTDADVDAEIERKRNQNARWVDVERSAREGDRVVIDYAGTLDGAPFEGGKAENKIVEIGAGRFIPGFEEQLVGMAKGEEKDIEVTFPEDYPSEALKGKPAVFHIRLHDVKEKEIPEPDDEFAKDISEFETLEELKNDVREKLSENARERSEGETEDNVIRAVSDTVDIDIPDAMCEAQVDDQIARFEYNLAMQGIRLNDYLAYTGMKLEDLREQQKKSAYNMVKTQLVLDAVMEKEKLDATEEEVEAAVAKDAERMKASAEEYKKRLGAEGTEGIRDRIRYDKTVKMLVEHAQLTEKKAARQRGASGRKKDA